MGISVVGLFCEDIREEKSGQDTLIGLLPDNVNLTSMPGAFPKLAAYVRIHLTLDIDPGEITMRFVFPDGNQVTNVVPAQLAKKAREDARQSGNAIVGLISKAIFSPLQIAKVGTIQIVVTILGQEYIAGILNIRLDESKMLNIRGDKPKRVLEV